MNIHRAVQYLEEYKDILDNPATPPEQMVKIRMERGEKVEDLELVINHLKALRNMRPN